MGNDTHCAAGEIGKGCRRARCLHQVFDGFTGLLLPFNHCHHIIHRRHGTRKYRCSGSGLLFQNKWRNIKHG